MRLKEEVDMRYPTITIGRQHGSGGRTVAEKVAKELGIPLYDKLLIQLIAKESGFAEEYVKDTDMRRIQSFFYGMYIDSRNLPLEDQLYIAQSKVIKEVSEKGPCVIVGRCADYVLRERKDVLNVFIHAPLEERIERVRDTYHEIEKDYKKYLNKMDKQRANYYNHYTGKKWGASDGYHLVYSSDLGIDSIVKSIVRFAKGE